MQLSELPDCSGSLTREEEGERQRNGQEESWVEGSDVTLEESLNLHVRDSCICL